MRGIGFAIHANRYFLHKVNWNNLVSGQTCLTCHWRRQASWAVCSRPLYFLWVGLLSCFSPTNRWVGRIMCRGNILARWVDGLLQQWGTEAEKSTVIIMGFCIFFSIFEGLVSKMKIMPVSKINLKSKFFRKKQGKKVCKVTAVQCDQCFSLRLLLFLACTANWCTGQLLTAAGPL